MTLCISALFNNVANQRGRFFSSWWRHTLEKSVDLSLLPWLTHIRINHTFGDLQAENKTNQKSTNETTQTGTTHAHNQEDNNIQDLMPADHCVCVCVCVCGWKEHATFAIKRRHFRFQGKGRRRQSQEKGQQTGR